MDAGGHASRARKWDWPSRGSAPTGSAESPNGIINRAVAIDPQNWGRNPRSAAALVLVRPAREWRPPLAPKDVGGPGLLADTGPFPIRSLARAGDLGPSEVSLAGVCFRVEQRARASGLSQKGDLPSSGARAITSRNSSRLSHRCPR